MGLKKELYAYGTEHTNCTNVSIYKLEEKKGNGIKVWTIQLEVAAAMFT